MKHTIEELGEFADEHTDGGLCIWLTPNCHRGRNSSIDKPWGARLGDGNAEKHYAATPDEAVDAAMTAHERA